MRHRCGAGAPAPLLLPPLAGLDQELSEFDCKHMIHNKSLWKRRLAHSSAHKHTHACTPDTPHTRPPQATPHKSTTHQPPYINAFNHDTSGVGLARPSLIPIHPTRPIQSAQRKAHKCSPPLWIKAPVPQRNGHVPETSVPTAPGTPFVHVVLNPGRGDHRGSKFGIKIIKSA